MELCTAGSLWSALLKRTFHREHSMQTLGQRAPQQAQLQGAPPTVWDAWSTLETLREVASAVSFMHENRIVHGDLKAANVLLCPSHKDRRGFISKVAVSC